MIATATIFHMAYRAVSFCVGEFYHLYNRGTDKRPLFQDRADYVRFQTLLHIANSSQSRKIRDLSRNGANPYEARISEPLVGIGAYCLMPNHFHILLTPLAEEGVPRFMKKLGTSYSMYFNTRYVRTGTLFEGKYKSQYADTDRYLKYLYAYIHLNPLKVCREGEEDPLTALKRYPYSSLLDYLGYERTEGAILEPGAFPEYFREAADHIHDLEEWLSYREGLQVT